MEFSEKAFYLNEFRARSIGIALSSAEAAGFSAFQSVLQEFVGNRTRVVLMGKDGDLLRRFVGDSVLSASGQGWVGRLWRILRESPRVGLQLDPGQRMAARCREIATQLGLIKLVWVDEGGGLARAGGGRRSFMDLRELDALIASATRGDPDAVEPNRVELLREIRAMVVGGVPAVNLCTLAGLGDELFTYTGSGTLFTREGYTAVRSLILDEFEAAFDLIRRGVQEGYLAPRSDEDLARVLTNSFGVFVEGRHLAGIGALLTSEDGRAGEIASLYTLTRFVGEGVGPHLIRFGLELARDRGLDYVYACTTSKRVEDFFLTHGFRAVGPESIPEQKWRDYPPARRELVRCVRIDFS